MKTLEQSVDEARTVAMLRALANPIRFRMVRILAQHSECVTGDLVEALPLAQSSVSEHLKVLKEAGLVQGTVEGPGRCYCLNPAALAWLQKQMAAFMPSSCCP